MAAIFLYGTLRHIPLLEVVLGRTPSGGELCPARLGGYAVRTAAGEGFPLIVADPGSAAVGILLNATEEDRARIDYYEGGFHYMLRPVKPEGFDGPAEAYFPEEGRWRAGETWSLDRFLRDDGEVSLKAARALMALFGTIDADEAARRRPMLRAVARKSEVRLMPPPVELRTGFDQSDISLQGFRRSHDGFFALDEVELTHRRFDGQRSDSVSREGFIAVDAVIVLLYDPKRDRVALVEQIRVAPFLRGDPHPWMLEPVAGRIDPGESPEEAALRETREETGLIVRELLPVSRHYPSPGTSTEYYHCFVGLTDLDDGAEGQGGVDAEGEDIRTHVISFERLMRLLETGEAETGPLVLLSLWLSGQRARLRGSA